MDPPGERRSPDGQSTQISMSRQVPGPTSASAPVRRSRWRTTPPCTTKRCRPNPRPSTNVSMRAANATTDSPPGATNPSKVEQALLGPLVEVVPPLPLEFTEIELAQRVGRRRRDTHQTRRVDTASQVGAPDRAVGPVGDGRQSGRLHPTGRVQVHVGSAGVAPLGRPVGLAVPHEAQRQPHCQPCSTTRRAAAESTAISPICSTAPRTSPVVPP